MIEWFYSFAWFSCKRQIEPCYTFVWDKTTFRATKCGSWAFRVWYECTFELELVYLPKGKYCVYPRMVYSLAIVMPPPPPFWMTENEFWSYFSTFQRNTPNFCFTKWLPAAILDDRSHFSPFQINTQFYFVHKMAAGGHFGWPKIAFDHISRHFISIRNNFDLKKKKMAAGGHFGWPIITFECISRHFRSIRNLFFEVFFQNGRRWPFGSPICAKNNRVLPLCVINGYAKYEVDRWICDTVRDATSFLSIFI